MFFAQFNHTSWLPLYHLPITADANGEDFHRGILRVVLGNPLVAETMLQYDLTAGLAIPPELLILETKDRKGTEVVWNRPSDLVVGASRDQRLIKAARKLDQLFETFVEYLIL
jgi:uncharacterized protein (DUF302 family)